MNSQHKHGTHLERHLAQLKLVSRLLGHELHSQGGAKAVALSREQVVEMQVALDLFIEEATKRLGGRSGGHFGPQTVSEGPSAVPIEVPGATIDTQLAPTRN
ncbi:MAG: hypothetical protein ACPGPE_08250 [Planctomycetota bacterium]|jgi:hypothetical protein